MTYLVTTVRNVCTYFHSFVGEYSITFLHTSCVVVVVVDDHKTQIKTLNN